jgi:indole-3-glycerol phosphate synthase
MAFLHQILERKEQELAAAKIARDLASLKAMLRDAPPPRSFSGALRKGFGLIAEIKRRSPSAGEMRRENVEAAPAAYAKSSAVTAVSVLTNTTDFGMGIGELQKVRAVVSKPILRKDFIFDEYQIYEARAFGADALLLMANVLNGQKMQGLFALSRELGLDVLFEAHTKEEIESIPEGAVLYGINSRNFMASDRWQLTNSASQPSGDGKDLTVELETFSLINHLPKHTVKIAESGVKPDKVAEVIKLGYDAILVGTSLLKAPAGIEAMLEEFETAITGQRPAAGHLAGPTPQT